MVYHPTNIIGGYHLVGMVSNGAMIEPGIMIAVQTSSVFFESGVSWLLFFCFWVRYVLVMVVSDGKDGEMGRADNIWISSVCCSQSQMLLCVFLIFFREMAWNDTCFRGAETTNQETMAQ